MLTLKINESSVRKSPANTQPKDNKSCKICGSHSSVAEDSKGTSYSKQWEPFIQWHSITSQKTGTITVKCLWQNVLASTSTTTLTPHSQA